MIRTLESLAQQGGFFDGDWVESKDQDPQGEIRLLQLADVGDGEFRDRSDRHVNVETFARLRCSALSAGDILIARMPDPLGRACQLPAKQAGSITVVDVAVLRVKREIAHPRYIMYSINSAPFRSAVDAQQDGATRQRIPRKKLGKVTLNLPALAEQRAIADYLDRETAKIDTLIEKQTTMIERLRERRQGLLISLADAAQPGREMVQLRRVLTKCRDLPQSGSPVVTAYRDGVVVDRALRREEGYTFSDQESGYQRVRRGDLVFHALDGFAGATGLSQSDGQCSPVYHVCTVRGADPGYLALLLRAYGLSGRLTAYAWSVRQRSADYRNWALFASLYVPLPPLSEQRGIADHLDRETAKIDTLIAKVEHHIELARERRAALITAAVTGQIDATTTTQSGDAA